MISKIIKYIRKVSGTQKIISEQIVNTAKLSELEGLQKELLKAKVFSDTICESDWLKYKSFSPAGWALNYNALYFLYRILDIVQPKSILEFGYGQSSKMIYQYTHAFPEATAITYEHDEEWIAFFQKSMPKNIQPNIFLTQTIETTIYNQRTLTYQNNCEELKGKKFDLILVDGPHGSEHYSRSQILHIVPECLKDSFIIIIDDAQRNGEKETIGMLLQILKENGINHKYEFISTNRDFFVVYSCDLSYITTI